MTKCYLLLFLLLCSIFSFSQKLTKKELDKGFQYNDSSQLKKEKFYVVNGIAFVNSDSAKLDSALAVFDIKYLVSIDIMKCENLSFSHCYKDVILLSFATQQKAKTKRKIWHQAKHFIKENYPGNSPFVANGIKPFSIAINNVPVVPSEIKRVFNSMKVKNIYYVAFDEVTDDIEGKSAGAILKIWKKPS